MDAGNYEIDSTLYWREIFSYIISVSYTHLDVYKRQALLHGLNRHYESNAQVTVHINEYLKNAVKINELAPRGGNINESYILFGYGRVGEDSYPAYFVVNTYENGNTELDDFDVLYSANAKKIEGSALSSQGFNTSLPLSLIHILLIVQRQ